MVLVPQIGELSNDRPTRTSWIFALALGFCANAYFRSCARLSSSRKSKVVGREESSSDRKGQHPAHYLADKGWTAAPHRARATWLPLARTNVRLKANNFLERVQYWQSQTVQGARHRQYSAVFLSLDLGNVRSRQPPVADPSLCDSHHI
jgi:hypothetical protein